MANPIRVDMTTKYNILPMVQECWQNLQAKTFNNRAHVVHFLLCRAEVKEISLLIFTNRVLLWAPQRPGYHFRSKWVPLNLGKWKSHFLPRLGITDNAKFSIAFVPKIFAVLFSQDNIFIHHMSRHG